MAHAHMSGNIENFSASPVLHPAIEPYESGYLATADGHRIYWEQCGNPRGKPALFLHGGPGGGFTARDRRFFDPARYRIVLFDQRGCGRSLPHASIHANTTAHLIGDIEALRSMLDIERWLLVGGSWGATLALAYAQAHPQRASELILRGVFTARQSELDWLYREGASQLFPEAWERFIAPIPEYERGDLVAAYNARLNCGDADIERSAARAWCAWEDALATLLPQPASSSSDDALLALARIEAHYFVHRAFLDETQLIANAHRLRRIPGVIVQGRHDMIAPMKTAWDLHHAWPRAELHVVPDSGHATSEPGILRQLLAATEKLAQER